MTIRDTGYRQYEGTRLPPAASIYAFLSHGMSRTWSSWIVKLITFGGALLFLAYMGYFFVNYVLFAELTEPLLPAKTTNQVLNQMKWIFLPTLTVVAGAGVVSRDLALKTFQFYFSKPVTPAHYMAGRIGAVAIYCFLFTFPTALVWVLACTGTIDADERWTTAGLLFPTLLYALLISLVVSITSVGISAISDSRALTISAWIVAFVVPYVIAGIVDGIASLNNGPGWPWLKLASIPALLGIVGDALFRSSEPTKIHWGIALAVLIALCAVSLWGVHRRLQRAEVFN